MLGARDLRSAACLFAHCLFAHCLFAHCLFAFAACSANTDNASATTSLEGNTACEKWASLSQAKGCGVPDECDIAAECDVLAQDWLECAATDLTQCLCENDGHLNCEGSFKPNEGPASCIAPYQAFYGCIEAEPTGGERVGDACEPANVPDTGFEEQEVYVELSSPQCDGDACMVYRLAGDPRASCVPTPETPCPSPAEVAEHVYCSCVCNSNQDVELCECPDEYACVPATGVGSTFDAYCVKNTQ